MIRLGQFTAQSLVARFVAILAILTALPTSAKTQDPPRRILLSAQDEGGKASLLQNYGKIPLHFEPNVGQSDEQAKFISRGNGYAFFLTPSEAVLVLRQAGVAQRHAAPRKPTSHNLTELWADKLWEEPTSGEETVPQAVLHTRFLGANPNPVMSAADTLPGKANYFIGNDPKRWRTNIPSYGKVKYYGVYPGVDLVYYGNQAQLEYDFVVSPGASTKRIRMGVSANETSSRAGASTPMSLRIDANGDLVVSTTTREVRYQRPTAYQMAANGQKQLVAARFVLNSKHEVGFAVTSYDRNRTLVIDPTLIYATYIAGLTPGPYFFGYFGDQAAGIAVDSNGSAYVTGTTASGDFPTTPGAYQTVCKPYGNGCSNNGAWQPGYGTAVFVSKLSPDASSLVYSTYIAGSNTDSASGIAIDSSGNAYIAGTTNSPDFPTTQGAYQTVCGPRLDQINSAYCYGSHIISTCGPQGYPDGFVTKLNSTGSVLVYSTFLGGSLNDYLTGIAVDPAGEAYVSGFTLSSYSYSPPGGQCGCPNGAGTCDPNINVSASYGYPTTPGGYYPGPLPVPPTYTPWPFGSPSAFTLSAATVSAFPFSDNHTPVFSKLSADGSTMLYSTYIGGGLGPVLGNGWGDGQVLEAPLQQNATGIAIDSAGDAYLTGTSNASDLCCTQYGGYQFTGFPTTPGVIQPHNATSCANSLGYCGYDAFVTKFDPTVWGTGSLIYSTNLGGPGDDNATSIAVDSGGNAYVSGTANLSAQSAAPTFPTTPGTLQPTCPGSCNSTYGWVTKLNPTATAMDYSTYLSGPGGGNSPNGVTVDSAGNAYVAGTTNINDNFPQVNPLQGYPSGGNSAYISVLDPTASTLLFSTFLGGLGNNGAAGIALDSSDNIYVSGSTTSSAFPTTQNAFQTACTKCSTGSWGTFVSEISAVQQNKPTLQSISVSPSTASVAAGLTVQFTATGHYSDGSTQDVSTTATWSSSNTSIATISNAAGSPGLATGVAQGGPVTITATQSSIDGTARLTVTAAVLQSITVAPASASVAAGLTQQFTATGHYSDSSTQNVTTSVTWSSSNTSIASISNTSGTQGLATGVAVGGPVTITATLNGTSGTAQMTVTAPVLQSISVAPSSASIAKGLAQQFTATGHYSDGSAQNLTTSVTWSSSNTAIATISNTAGSQGVATGVSVGGPVTITATQGVSGTAQLSVTAAVPTSVVVTPANAQIPVGASQQFTAMEMFSDGAGTDVTKTAMWASTNTPVATISKSGLAKAMRLGSSTISATYKGMTGSTTLTTYTLTVSPNSATITVGSTQQFTAMANFANGSASPIMSGVAWSSSNMNVATINTSGLAKGIKSGKTTIKATVMGVGASASLTIR